MRVQHPKNFHKSNAQLENATMPSTSRSGNSRKNAQKRANKNAPMQEKATTRLK
jgi:hypothetical protein